jgi:2,3-dihydroxybenzoate decarboxylase
MNFDGPDLIKPWKVALEEHFAIPDTLGYPTPNLGKDSLRTLDGKLRDLRKQRIEEMDKTGVELSILSLKSPAIQAILDPKRAVEVARVANDHIAEAISHRPDRFRSFAALPMQDPDAACKELTRCIKDLRFVGALINGYSQIGEEDTSFYLDMPQYRPFWAEVEKLNVPVYLHPRDPLPSQQKPYDRHPWLLGAAWAFGVETATHALRLMCSGLFDEHPNLQIILGHLGEGLPFSIWRAEHRMVGIPAKKKISQYFCNNFWVTTSGNFHTQSLMNTILEMGSDHILYSVDYPFENMVEADEWFKSVNIASQDQVKIGRLNAQKLFHLEDRVS